MTNKVTKHSIRWRTELGCALRDRNKSPVLTSSMVCNSEFKTRPFTKKYNKVKYIFKLPSLE
jgi:hypothetical protein